MREYKYVILFVALLGACTQKPAEVIHKGGGIYNPNYSEVYVESPDGKIARSLRGSNNGSKAQEVSIINKNMANSSSNASYYTVQNGDSLWSISKKYNMTISELAALNNLDEPYNIIPNQRLKISNVKGFETVKVVRTETYTVKTGDTLSGIADKFNMKTSEIAELNGIEKPYNIMVGQKLKVNVVSEENQRTGKKYATDIYIVRSGDNLSSIATKHNMTLDQIAGLNNLEKPYTLRVGQKILINKNATGVAVNDTKQMPRQTVKSTTNKTAVVANTDRQKSFAWPVKGEIVSSFGNKANGLYNDGINISAPRGTNFRATDDGVVAYVGNELRGYGTIILIKHNNNWISAYAHCGSVKVARGDKVERGQIIGTIGQTGNVSTPQLYFSLRHGREAVDPIKYLK